VTLLKEKAGQLGDFATGAFGGVMAKLNDSPIGGVLKGLDKDGDGNPVNDLVDGAKNMLGGIFGKKE